MSAEDRARWDRRYARSAGPTAAEAGPPAVFIPFADSFPSQGHAVDLACGRGLTALWLARRGLTVWAFDVSPVAIGQARELAHSCGVAQRCHFEAVDLDDGLPAGPPANVIVCLRFRDDRLDQAVVERLAPGGLLAITALSDVGGKAGPFRVGAGELERAFAALDILTAGAANGEAWLLGRK